MSRLATIPNRAAICCAVALLLAATLPGCGRDRENVPGTETGNPPAAGQPASVVELSLGTAVGSDNRVTSPTTTFAPNDTVYAAVTTEGGSGDVDLEARWTYEDGQEVETQSQSVQAGRRTTEFHIQKPDGWPPGGYQVEILVNGQQAESRSFTVR